MWGVIRNLGAGVLASRTSGAPLYSFENQPAMVRSENGVGHDYNSLPLGEAGNALRREKEKVDTSPNVAVGDDCKG